MSATTDYQDYWINPRIKIAALWASMMFVFVFVDLFSLYRGDVRADIEAGQIAVFTIGQGYLLGVTLYVVLPSRMRRSHEYTGDQTAFDVALAFGRADAEILVGIETKYHEWAEPEASPHPTERLARYRVIAETSGIFKPDWDSRILGKPIQQIWRDHMLLLFLLQHDSRRWVGGKYVLVHPKGNPSFRDAAAEYRKALVRGQNEPTFLVLTVEEVLDRGVLTPETEAMFRARYLLKVRADAHRCRLGCPNGLSRQSRNGFACGHRSRVSAAVAESPHAVRLWDRVAPPHVD